MSGGEQKNGFDLIFFSLKIFTQEFLDKRDINVRQIEIYRSLKNIRPIM